jgi:hypothetical protein
MDLSKLATDGLTGAATGIVGGPIGIVAGLLGGVLPDFLQLLGPHAAGPQGQAVANAVVQVVSAATGQANPTSANIIGLDPAAQADLKVKLAEIYAQAQANERADQAAQRANELDTLRAEFADVASARARDVALKAAGGHNYQANMMLTIACTVLLACVVAAATGRMNDIALGMIVSLAGVMAACFRDAFNFEFGSSRQAQFSGQTVAGLAQTAQTALANSTPVR